MEFRCFDKPILLSIICLACGVAVAKTCVWTQKGDPYNWSREECWDQTPEDGDDVIINNAGVSAGFGTIFSFDGATTPALKSLTFRCPSVTSAWNFQNGTLVFQKANPTINLSESGKNQIRLVIGNNFKFRTDDADDTLINLAVNNPGEIQFQQEQDLLLMLTASNGAVLRVKQDSALGPVPANVVSNQIVLTGASLGLDGYAKVDVELAATRGIEIRDGSNCNLHADNGNLTINGPVWGNGSVQIVRTSDTVTLNGKCSYTGDTRLGVGSGGETRCRVVLGADDTLPATTHVSANVSAASIDLNGHAQTIAGVTGTKTVSFEGPGTLTGTDAAFDCSKVALTGGASFVYAGTGALDPCFASPNVSCHVTSGSLAFGLATVGARPLVTLAQDTMLTLNGDTTFAGALLSDDADNPVTVTVSGGTLTFGAEGVCSRLGVNFVPVESVVFANRVETTLDISAFEKLPGFVKLPQPPIPTGDQTLQTGDSLFIQDVTLTGTGGEALTLNGTSIVVLAPEEDMTAAYTVSLDDNSVFEFSGSGMTTFNGTIQGSGRVVFSSGVASLQGDLTGLTAVMCGGTVYVPEGETLTLDAVEGTIVKAGPGTLTVNGSNVETSTFALDVREGTLRVGGDVLVQGQCTVAPDATLALDADDVFSHNLTLLIDGTFDLNGHSPTIASFSNFREESTTRRAYTARIVNTASTPSTLSTLGEETYFYGAVEETPGTIRLQCKGTLGLFGPKGSSAVSEVNSTFRLHPYAQHGSLIFVFQPPQNPANRLQIADILPLYKGLPVAVKSVDSTGAASGHEASRAADGYSNTYWESNATGDGKYLSVALSTDGETLGKADGYRLAVVDAAHAPTGWDVYSYRAKTTDWVLVDSRRNVSFSRHTSTFIPSNFTFNAEGRFGSVFGTNTAVSIASNNLAMRLDVTDPLVTGPFSGAGIVRIERGSALEPGDLSGFTGGFTLLNCSNRATQASIRISTRGGDEQRVVVTNAGTQANLAVANAGADLVSLLIDDASPDISQRGRLIDGEGPLGLVKRGVGTRYLETEESGNTGPTRIEEGTLCVLRRRSSSKPATARYIRFTPTCVKGGVGWVDSWGYNWGATEIELLDANGAKVAWPSGTKVQSAQFGAHSTDVIGKLIDGNTSTRTIIKHNGGAELPPAVIDTTQTGVTFCGYRWYTLVASDANRTPVSWTLEVSDDNENWTLVDVSAYANAPVNNYELRGPFGLNRGRRAASDAPSLYTLPEEHLVTDGNPRATRATALSAQYFRLWVYATRNPESSDTGYGWQLAEFGLMRNGERVDWPSGTTGSCEGSSVSSSNNSKLSNLYNNVLDDPKRGNNASTLERTFVLRPPSCVTINATRPLEFDTYSMYTSAGGGAMERIPTCWTLEISNDGKAWTKIDAVTGFTSKAEIYTEMGPFPVAEKYPLLGLSSGADSLGDASPVVIASGATLQIAADYEKFGTLSGAGTLDLDQGSTAEINACTPAAAFSGAVTGGGTLVVSGTNVQAFAAADLSGVANLELAGGTVTGSASFGNGNLALTCTGGALWAELSGIGALSLAGTPKIAVPDAALAENGARIRLVSAQSIPATAQEAFRNAEVVLPDGAPASWRARVTATDTEVKVSFGASATVLIVR